MISIDLENVPIDITEHIKKFRLFLISCWPHIDNLMEFHDWDSDGGLLIDWIELNWKTLVERELLEDKGVLTPLKVPLPEDFSLNPKKKFSIEARLTSHKINQMVKIEKNDLHHLRFFGFSTAIKNGFGLYPPFDTASIVNDHSKKIFKIPFEFLDFYLVEYPMH